MSIKFVIKGVHHGLARANGVIYLEDEYLVFKFRVKTLKLIKQDPETVKIALGALWGMHLKKGIRGDWLYIRPRGTELLRVMPGRHREEVRLRIRRKYRDQVKDLIAQAVRQAVPKTE